MSELKASRMNWRKLRRLLTFVVLIGGGATAGAYVWSGNSLLFGADGIVTRDRIAVTAPWSDARVREVFVHPGDQVLAGQKIAMVESASMLRSLADLAAEKARISSRLAQLESRKAMVAKLLPLAIASNEEVDAFLKRVQKTNADGLSPSKTLVDLTTASVQAAERKLSLQAEEASLDQEIASNRTALAQVSGGYADLQASYNDGALYAPVTGYVGANVAVSGEVLNTTRDRVANIYSGPSFVMAYLPEGYLFDVTEGDRVAVKARGQTVVGKIERILPVSEMLPPEFQVPNKVRGRGQLVRISIDNKDAFAIDQTTRVSGCYFRNCGSSISEIGREISGGIGATIARLTALKDAVLPATRAAVL